VLIKQMLKMSASALMYVARHLGKRTTDFRTVSLGRSWL